MQQRAALALTLGAILWICILVTAPAAISRPVFAVPSAAVYALSSRICHQRPERSFHLAGVQMPVCGRCFGLYLSGAVGAVIAWGRRRLREDRTRPLLALAAVPTAVTWGAEVAGLAAFSNLTRAAAALPLGIVAGWVLVQMLRYDFSLNGQIDDRGSRARRR